MKADLFLKFKQKLFFKVIWSSTFKQKYVGTVWKKQFSCFVHQFRSQFLQKNIGASIDPIIVKGVIKQVKVVENQHTHVLHSFVNNVLS